MKYIIYIDIKFADLSNSSAEASLMPRPSALELKQRVAYSVQLYSNGISMIHTVKNISVNRF